MTNTLPLFDGETYNSARDGERMNSQFHRVFTFMKDGRWHSLPEIAEACSGSTQAMSARLRDCRKVRFGGHSVERRYLADGLWEYRLVVRS